MLTGLARASCIPNVSRPLVTNLSRLTQGWETWLSAIGPGGDREDKSKLFGFPRSLSDVGKRYQDSNPNFPGLRPAPTQI